MFILYTSILFLFSCVHHGEFAKTATAVLYQNSSNATCGTLTISQNNSTSPVVITGFISQLNNNSAHGFHVHTNPVSETFPNCIEAGAHFNPYNTSHGPRTGNITNRHVGDLGNLTTSANGTVNVSITDSIIQLYNTTQSILNRTFVIHLMSDDGGTTGISESNTTGNAGGRFFCGLIKLVSDKPSMAILNTKSSLSILSITIIFISLFFY